MPISSFKPGQELLRDDINLKINTTVMITPYGNNFNMLIGALAWLTIKGVINGKQDKTIIG